MKKYILIIVTILFSLTLLQSQSKAQHQIDIMGGSNIGLFKDVNFSPLNYKATGSFSGVKYSKSKNNNLFAVSIDYTKAKLTTHASEYFTVEDNHLVNFSLEYLRRIVEPRNRLSFYLGGQYRTFGNLVDWYNLDAFTFNFAHSLGAATLVEYEISRNQSIHSSLSVPLITLLVRPPYAGLDKTLGENESRLLSLISTGEFTSLNKYVAIDWSSGYALHLSKRFVINLEYRLSYQHVNDIHSYINMQNHFKAGFGIKF